jgi:hypothetical protein
MRQLRTTRHSQPNCRAGATRSASQHADRSAIARRPHLARPDDGRTRTTGARVERDNRSGGAGCGPLDAVLWRYRPGARGCGGRISTREYYGRNWRQAAASAVGFLLRPPRTLGRFRSRFNATGRHRPRRVHPRGSWMRAGRWCSPRRAQIWLRGWRANPASHEISSPMRRGHRALAQSTQLGPQLRRPSSNGVNRGRTRALISARVRLSSISEPHSSQIGLPARRQARRSIWSSVMSAIRSQSGPRSSLTAGPHRCGQIR